MNGTLQYTTIENIATLDRSDYAIFFLMIIIPSAIGIYFGCFGSKQKSIDEYLLAGKSMMALPVAFSLISSAISGVTIIGLPAEVYTDKCTYGFYVVSLFLASVFAYYFFIPVFYDTDVNNAIKYLELRFDSTIRNVGSFFYCLNCLLYMPAVIYVPALALSQVTGVNLYVMSIVITISCIFYTMMGGLKAVIWSDFFQFIIMVVTGFVIKIIGTDKAGGISYVLSTGYRDGKMDIFNMDINPFQRNTFWTMVTGRFVALAVHIGSDQGFVQRFLCLSSHKNVKIVMVIFTIGLGLLVIFSVYDGLLIYATYYGCDPIREKVVSQADKIFPYFILDKVGDIPTLTGFFIAGVLSAALSTLSTNLNVTAGTIYENHIKKIYGRQDRAHIIIKLITVLLGIFSIMMIFVIERIGNILAASYIVTSVTLTPINLIYIFGMMIPVCNKTGAITGIICSTLFLAWIAIGSSISKINFTPKNVYPENVNTCGLNSSNYNNSTMFDSIDMSTPNDEVFFLYKLSFIVYDAVGIIVGIPIALIVSYITGPIDCSKLDPNLISPPIRRFLPKKIENETEEKLLEMKTIFKNAK